MSTSTLMPANEIEAIALFTELGREAAHARLNALGTVADSRYKASWEKHRTMPVGFTALNFLTDDERNERYLLITGMMLCIDEKAEARDRIALRIAQRKARRISPASEHVLTQFDNYKEHCVNLSDEQLFENSRDPKRLGDLESALRQLNPFPHDLPSLSHAVCQLMKAKGKKVILSDKEGIDGLYTVHPALLTTDERFYGIRSTNSEVNGEITESLTRAYINNPQSVAPLSVEFSVIDGLPCLTILDGHQRYLALMKAIHAGADITSITVLQGDFLLNLLSGSKRIV